MEIAHFFVKMPQHPGSVFVQAVLATYGVELAFKGLNI